MGNVTGKALPYTPGSLLEGLRYKSIWNVYDGHTTGDPNAKVLVWRFEKKNAPTHGISMASNALKRLKSLRHPYVLKLIVSCGSI